MNIFKKLCIYLYVVAIAITTGCEKTKLRSTEFDLVSDKAFVRFGLFSPGTPSVIIKVDTAKINATTSGNGGLFPAIINAPDYAAVRPGGNFRVSIPNAATLNDSVLFFSGQLGVEAGKFYSVSLADTGVDRTVFAIEDKFVTRPADSMMNVRFINAMPKTQPLSLIRIDSASATVVTRDTIAVNIPYKGASAYVPVRVYPRNSFLRYRMVITATGQMIGPSISLTLSSGLFYRSVTFYGYGFGNGTGIYAPSLLGPVYNQ